MQGGIQLGLGDSRSVQRLRLHRSVSSYCWPGVLAGRIRPGAFGATRSFCQSSPSLSWARRLGTNPCLIDTGLAYPPLNITKLLIPHSILWRRGRRKTGMRLSLRILPGLDRDCGRRGIRSGRRALGRRGRRDSRRGGSGRREDQVVNVHWLQFGGGTVR